MLIKVNKNNDKYEVSTLNTDNIELQTKTATVNGDVEPDEGYYGLSKVVVNVSQPVLPPSCYILSSYEQVPLFVNCPEEPVFLDENDFTFSASFLNPKRLTNMYYMSSIDALISYEFMSGGQFSPVKIGESYYNAYQESDGELEELTIDATTPTVKLNGTDIEPGTHTIETTDEIIVSPFASGKTWIKKINYGANEISSGTTFTIPELSSGDSTSYIIFNYNSTNHTFAYSIYTFAAN